MEQWMPAAAMVATNVVIAIMTALIKQALNQGMNRLVMSKAKGEKMNSKETAGRFLGVSSSIHCCFGPASRE
jgi:hypothetical protein